MNIRSIAFAVILVVVFLFPASAQAQTYSFSLDEEIVHVYWNQDGTMSIDYMFVFTNDTWASPIDFVDVGLPNSNFDAGSINADVDGYPVLVSRSEYQGGGSGVAVVMGSAAIQPGQTGRVHVFVGTIRRVLYTDSQESTYASAVFSPTWFGSEFVHGTTNLQVIFHLPPGVQPDEPRWHAAPAGWATEPATGFDDQGRITYTWSNAQALGSLQYSFGASFPKSYVPDSAIVQPSIWQVLGIDPETLFTFTFCCGIGLLIVLGIVASVRATQKRRLQYLPPKIAIEGHGIKRGLTAIEAAILMEQPMDKILTMILFAVVKKGAASVIDREPLKIEVITPQPEGLLPYEEQFLKAFTLSKPAGRRNALQDMSIDLIKNVSNKMKGFSRKETLAYYKDIVNRAWSQVEAADTPEVKSQKYDEVMEWTMLDKDYDDRTREVFRTGPVFVPVWWGNYDPGFGRAAAARPAAAPTTGPAGTAPSLPHLPGSDFAASVVNGVQDFSSNVIGNITDFTSKITNKTNPVPVTSSSSGRWSGGGGGCACACACAGCACACAGGGR